MSRRIWARLLCAAAGVCAGFAGCGSTEAINEILINNFKATVVEVGTLVFENAVNDAVE
ncbi:MAG: hypothetical protein HOP29_00825 [Phycisphaerales bacterium]|nr:hypothetical protein [Phycisphaerales bacterium]